MQPACATQIMGQPMVAGDNNLHNVEGLDKVTNGTASASWQSTYINGFLQQHQKPLEWLSISATVHVLGGDWPEHEH